MHSPQVVHDDLVRDAYAKHVRLTNTPTTPEIERKIELECFEEIKGYITDFEEDYKRWKDKYKGG